MILTGTIISMTYFFGGIKSLQNNHIVLIAIFGFTPLLVGLEIKYKVLSGTS
jgi:hypothetical protein